MFQPSPIVQNTDDAHSILNQRKVHGAVYAAQAQSQIIPVNISHAIITIVLTHQNDGSIQHLVTQVTQYGIV